MAKNFERQVVLVKNEGTPGVDAVPTAADNAISIVDATKPEIDPQIIEQGNPLPSLSKLKPLIGARLIKMPLRVPFYGSGTVDVAPRIGDLFEGAGFGETINAASDVTYAPASASFKTNSIYQYLAGALYKSLGSVSGMKISGKAGEPVIFDFDVVGQYQDDADASVVSPTFESNYKTPPQMLGVTLTLDSITTFILREFNIDMGISVANRPDAGEANGYAVPQVGSRNPSGNIIIEGETKATYDFLAKFKAATEVACTLLVGSVAGNKLEISMPKLTYTNLGIEEGDGIVIFNIPISINANAGDDEISLKHF